MLGPVGFCHKFISQFGEFAEPLFKLLNKGAKFDWSESCETAFSQPKVALLNTSSYSPFSKKIEPFECCTHASLTRIGANLS